MHSHPKSPRACTYREKHKKKWMDGWMLEEPDRIALLAENRAHLATAKKATVRKHEDGSSIHIPGYEIVPEEATEEPPAESASVLNAPVLPPPLTRESLLELLDSMTRVEQ